MPKLLVVPNPLEVGERIRAYREQQGLSQKQLAEETGMDTSQICRYEKGTELPGTNALSRLCAVMDCTFEYLLYGRIEQVVGKIDVQLREPFLELNKFSPETRRAVIDSIYAHMSREIMEKRALEPRKDPDTGIIPGKPANGRKA